MQFITGVRSKVARIHPRSPELRGEVMQFITGVRSKVARIHPRSPELKGEVMQFITGARRLAIPSSNIQLFFLSSQCMMLRSNL